MGRQMVPPGWQGGGETSSSSAVAAPIPPTTPRTDLPPPPLPPTGATRRRPPWPLIGGGVAAVIVIVTVVIALVAKANSEDEITALGSPVEEPTEPLRKGERLMDRLVGYLDDSAADVAVDDDPRCWYSYPEGEDEPNEFLRCGPLLYADSAPEAYWLNLPVAFAERDGSTRITLVEEAFEPWRTHALEHGERLVHPRRDAPDLERIDLTRPAALAAEPGTVGLVDPTTLAVELGEQPEDGRLNGLETEITIRSFTYADRVRLAEDSGPGTVREAADGEEWLVVEIDAWMVQADRMPMYPLAAAASLSLRADDTVLPFPPETAGGGSRLRSDETMILAFSVPDDADELALVNADENLTQEWSFLSGQRLGASPAVLYRSPEERSATIARSFTLPYGANSANDRPAQDFGEAGVVPGLDFSSAFGEVNLVVEIGEATLDYGVAVETASGEMKNHIAPAPDRALLHIDGVEVQWGQIRHGAYRIKPEDAVVTLEDGTRIAAQKVPEEATDTVHSRAAGLLPGTLVWDVPANLTKATLTIRLSVASNVGDEFTIDFRGGVIEIPLEFGG